MADKNDVFVLARRREDNVEMVLGRKFINQYPHLFEEIGFSPASVVKRTKIEEVPVVVEVEDTDISMEFNTKQGFTEPESVEEYRAALDVLGVDYLPQHGIPGLKKLYEENK
jgi:hypothetical protein